MSPAANSKDTFVIIKILATTESQATQVRMGEWPICQRNSTPPWILSLVNLPQANTIPAATWPCCYWVPTPNPSGLLLLWHRTPATTASPVNQQPFPRTPTDSIGPDIIHSSWKNSSHRPMYTPARRTVPEALLEARLIQGIPEDSGFTTRGQADLRYPRRFRFYWRSGQI